jgi:superfamily II DNA or RNA helicase
MATARIIIKDEVNVKIEGLDLDTRKELVKKFKYFQQSARYQPAFKLGRWDGYVGFFGIGGTTYTNLLEKIIPILDQKGYYLEVEDERSDISLEFDKITEEYWGNRTWPEGHRFAGQPIRLRDDQVDAINNFLSNPQSMAELATGFGKTILTATLCNICEKYGRTITIVPNKSLVEQTEEDFINVGLDVGVFYGDRKELNRTHTICTWQSLNVLDKKTKNNEADIITLAEFLENVQAVIVDECHQASAAVLKNILTQNLRNAPIRWGITGTIPKDPLDFENIRCSLGEVIGKVSAHDLQQKGVLSNCHVNVIQTQEWREFGSYPEELKYLVTDPDRLKWMAQNIKTIAETGNTLVLVDRIECGKTLQKELSCIFSLLNQEPDVAFISGDVKLKDRKKEYAEVATSDNRITLATYGVAAVGINIPRIFNLVLIEPGKSFVRVIQSIGRGIRRAEDKDFVNIWDITANTKYAKRHLSERKSFYKDAQYPFTIQKVKT